MLMTSNEANKTIKSLRDSINAVRSNEKKSYMFVAATSENIEDARPVYDFKATDKNISEAYDNLVRVKHALNVFNTTTKLPDLDITIDEALVRLPILNEKADKLKTMTSALPKERVNNFNSSTIEYKYINYDLMEVLEELNDTLAMIISIQTSLDYVNNTVKFDVDLRQ